MALYAFIIFILSTDALSGITIINFKPLYKQTPAKPIPVFPLVASIIVVFLFIFPFFSASSIIFKLTRSFTLPKGFSSSTFIYMLLLYSSLILFKWTRLVLPIISKTFSLIIFSPSVGIIHYFPLLFKLNVSFYHNI